MFRIFRVLIIVMFVAVLAHAAGAEERNIQVESKAQRAGFDIPAQVLADQLAARLGAPASSANAPELTFRRDDGLGPETFQIAARPESITISAATKAGALFGVGHVLRNLAVREGKALYLGGDHEETPAMALRGHQLGFRAHANSYDAWTPEQFEQYIVELAFFGTNMIENIPFQDPRPTLNDKISRREMNQRMSAICDKYGLQYWVWTPADFDLNDRAKAVEQLNQYEELYRDCVHLDGVFFPGGDPGDNPPQLVLPYLSEVAVRLAKHQPDARVWMSVQGFSLAQCAYVYDWIAQEQPKWLGGLVGGPSSPTLQSMRKQLAPEYGLRDYPDITHTVRAQNPVYWWDPAYAATLGRECINARPLFHKVLFDFFAPFISGFGTYSDGIHDDLNKIVYSRLGCDPKADIRTILAEYARLFWGDEHAGMLADALIALEKNWDGSLKDNGSVEGTLRLWHELEKSVPTLNKTWRGQMFLALAEYDAYVRRRLIDESALEASFIESVSNTAAAFDDASLDHFVASLQPQASAERDALRDSIAARYDFLFHAIGLQSSMEKYKASGVERGCSLDTIDYPMNNRWWIEDEFKKVRALPLAERAAAVRRIAQWEDAGPGGYYDNVGHPGKSPHVVRNVDAYVEPDFERVQTPGHWMWDNGQSRQRLSFQVTMDWPAALRYDGLDPKKSYKLRITGFGKAYPVADGTLSLAPSLEGTEIGAIKEFPIPREATLDGRLEITFRRPTDEAHLNWRQHSRVSEVWLISDENSVDK